MLQSGYIIAIICVSNLWAGCVSTLDSRLGISQEEYDIYSAAVDSLFINAHLPQRMPRRYDLILLADSTRSHYTFPDGEVKPNCPLLAFDSLRNAFVQANTRRYAVSASAFNLPIRRESISRGQMHTLMRRTGSIFDTYPFAPGVLTFTRVGIDHSSGFAVFILFNACGMLCGSEGTVIMHKDQGKWKVVYYVVGAVS
jgi:hypothetical protein